MNSVSIKEIQQDLPGYLKRVEAGETLIVISKDRAVAEIKPVEKDSGNAVERPAGLASGDFVVPDDFDTPLSARWGQLFSNSGKLRGDIAIGKSESPLTR